MSHASARSRHALLHAAMPECLCQPGTGPVRMRRDGATQ